MTEVINKLRAGEKLRDPDWAEGNYVQMVDGVVRWLGEAEYTAERKRSDWEIYQEPVWQDVLMSW